MSRKISGVSPLTQPSASAILQNILHSVWPREENKILSELSEWNNRLKQKDGRLQLFSSDNDSNEPYYKIARHDVLNLSNLVTGKSFFTFGYKNYKKVTTKSRFRPALTNHLICSF